MDFCLPSWRNHRRPSWVQKQNRAFRKTNEDITETAKVEEKRTQLLRGKIATKMGPSPFQTRRYTRAPARAYSRALQSEISSFNKAKNVFCGCGLRPTLSWSQYCPERVIYNESVCGFYLFLLKWVTCFLVTHLKCKFDISKKNVNLIHRVYLRLLLSLL